jgi:hypothetical protein
VDLVVAEHVGRQEVVEAAHERADRQRPPRREAAGEVRHDGEDVDLVERHPVGHEVAEVVDRGGDPGGEALGAVGLQPEVRAEPPRMGEVVQRDQRGQATVEAGGQDLAVPVEGRRVDLAVGRFAAGPLDRQAEPVAAGGDGPVEQSLGFAPEVDGDAGRFHPPVALPSVPVVAGFARPVVATLDLEPGRGHPEAEAVGEQEPRITHGAGR